MLGSAAEELQKREQRLGQWQQCFTIGNYLDKRLKKLSGWKDAMGSAQGTFSQGGNFLSSTVALPRAVGTVATSVALLQGRPLGLVPMASLGTEVKERGTW